MRELIVTLDNTADASLLQRMIENMKGVIKARLSVNKTKSMEEDNKWIDMLHSIKRDIDPSLIDLNDERTKYIMSK